MRGLDERPTQKNIVILVAGKVKKTSGGFLMWDKVISSGQEWSLKALYESDVKDLYDVINPPIRGELCSIPEPTNVNYEKGENKMQIKKDKLEGKKNWYDFILENYEKLNKLTLYLTTMSENFTITARKRPDKTYIGYINTEIEINEDIIEKWYDEIEGGGNNMHETIN